MEKPSLPIKTKIAIGLQNVISIFVLFPLGILSLWTYFYGLSAAASPWKAKDLVDGILAFLVFAIFIISRFSMLKRKKIGWWIGIIANALCLVIWISLFFNLLFFAIFPSILTLSIFNSSFPRSQEFLEGCYLKSSINPSVNLKKTKILNRTTD